MSVKIYYISGNVDEIDGGEHLIDKNKFDIYLMNE